MTNVGDINAASGSRATDPVNPATTPLEASDVLLLVQPIIKSTLNQRDSSGNSLDVFATSGSTFQEIIHKLWEHCGDHVKGRAENEDGVWSMEPATPIKLLIYEYGLRVVKAQDLEDFFNPCIRPVETDRAGAAAESCVHDVVDELQEHWSYSPLQLRANSTMRNLDRSTWGEAMATPPQEHLRPVFGATPSEGEDGLANPTRSAEVALECVNGSLADYEDLHKEYEIFGNHLCGHQRNLNSRIRIIVGLLRDLAPPTTNEVNFLE
ncbi:unnamed protein product [Phytophthora fragariaefolia]|uniref:Unnamed protein product n=1 Tax=Phytophthora fragariaefolia TaxID=1490495 RepID=A0A9W6WSV3_9STRA|nr:unnamed protein product [Phytophthora fragariaefolia]